MTQTIKANGVLDTKTMTLFGITMLLSVGMATAGTDTTFNSIVTTIRNWTEGSMGDMFALGTLAVGLALAIVKQSLMAVVVAAAIAIAANWGPAVLLSISTAVL